MTDGAPTVNVSSKNVSLRPSPLKRKPSSPPIPHTLQCVLEVCPEVGEADLSILNMELLPSMAHMASLWVHQWGMSKAILRLRRTTCIILLLRGRCMMIEARHRLLIKLLKTK